MSATPPDQPDRKPEPVGPNPTPWGGTEADRGPVGDGATLDEEIRNPASTPDAPRYSPGPVGVPHPHVPPRLDPDAPERSGATPGPTDLPFLMPPSSRSWWTLRRLGAVLVAVVLVVVLVIGLLFWLSVEAYQKQRAAASDIEVRTALVATAHQMAAYRADNDAFPTDLGQLRGPGYAPDPKVDVALLPVARPSADFCLAAGPAGGKATMWYSSASGPMDQPCG